MATTVFMFVTPNSKLPGPPKAPRGTLIQHYLQPTTDLTAVTIYGAAPAFAGTFDTGAHTAILNLTDPDYNALKALLDKAGTCQIIVTYDETVPLPFPVLAHAYV